MRRKISMNTPEIIYLSKKGMKELKKQIARLEREQKEIILELREIDKTDSHDERLARVEKLSMLDIVESQLADKKMLLSRAKLFPRKRDALKVAIGSVVDLIDTQGRLVRYTIVDSFEANPSDGRLSIKSPLGQNLIGRQIQDIVEWSSGFRANRVQLVAIA
jgi:transcription elongation factor GreA